MMVRLVGLGTVLAVLVACGAEENGAPAAETGAAPAPDQVALSADADQPALACEPVDRMPLEGRESPYDSVSVNLGGQDAKLCYGRPSMRGREIFGSELVPYDTLWRTGANEPTTIHLPFPAEIAGISVEPGSYTIYTVPGREEWTVIVNRSTSQWGIETSYTPEVRAQEVGRAPVPAETTDQPVEMFTITAEPTGQNAADLVLEWEETRVRIPIRRV